MGEGDGEGDADGDAADDADGELDVAGVAGDGVGRDAALLEPQAARVSALQATTERMATTWATNLKEPSVFCGKAGVKSQRRHARTVTFPVPSSG